MIFNEVWVGADSQYISPSCANLSLKSPSIILAQKDGSGDSIIKVKDVLSQYASCSFRLSNVI